MKEIIMEGIGIMLMLAVVVMIGVFVAMCVDFVSGWRKASERGDEHTSYAASRSLTKFLIYEGMCLIGVCMDTMIHLAWGVFVDGVYYVPLVTIGIGMILCTVEIFSVKEKADKKQRKRMEDAAAALAAVLDKDMLLSLLQQKLEKKASEGS